MRNKTVGILLLGVALLMGVIIILFNKALTDIVRSACSHGSDCPMWDTITFQTRVSIGILVFVLVCGFYLLFFSKDTLEQERDSSPLFSSTMQEQYESVRETLSEDERKVLESIIEAQGTIFQSALVDKVRFPKAKVTRILDRLEGLRLVERRRRGMANIVVLLQK